MLEYLPKLQVLILEIGHYIIRGKIVITNFAPKFYISEEREKHAFSRFVYPV